MAEAVMGAGAREGASRRFYMWMAASCFLIAVIGFLPTYFVPMAKGAFKAEPMVHIHGLVLFSWVTFFFTQTWLVAQGKVLAHRSWGMLGISIITAIVFIVTTIMSVRMAQAATPGEPPAAVHAARAFAWVTMGALAFIVPVFVLAIVKLKDSETHKRLILVLTISMLGAPIARWFSLLAPPAPPWPAGLPDITAPPVVAAVVAALVGDILLFVAMAYDWRTRGRVHPVYLIAGGIMLLMHLTMPIVGDTAAWQSVATAIGKLGLPTG